MMAENRKIALITGGSSGLGAALTKELKEKYYVINAARREATGADYNIYADFSRPETVPELAAEIETTFGRLDLLVNNAGIGAYGTFEELKNDELRLLVQVDLLAPVELTKALLPMLECSQGTIVNIASMAAKIHVVAMGGYCLAKSALAAFSETLRAELLPRKVRVLTVYPGRINTGFSSRSIKYREVPDTPANSNVKPGDFARKVMRALSKPKTKRLFFPWWYRPGIWAVKLVENRYDRLNLKYWNVK